MQTVDFSPLFRSAIGFDRMLNMLDTASRESNPAYPPYNIELLDENSYRITMAVSGFAEEELDIRMERSVLTVSGKKSEKKQKRQFLHQGIAERNFERRFQLADHVKVVDAKLENGLLDVELIREIPEAMKPKSISINAGGKTKVVNG
ncbi:Hsp20 family protein [Pelagibaculum spongiae]|uniref:Heat-shock protein n=1 Tax=Pelagibaculum spongiae TaxID=2080658 RepID=A0A2V1GWX8_9GAMM|nr:Hsp20 family protein [Pelagibaculum spongiae]PVZ70510.1 heat-shock protein [Pelagibaculum spongiae]